MSKLHRGSVRGSARARPGEQYLISSHQRLSATALAARRFFSALNCFQRRACSTRWARGGHKRLIVLHQVEADAVEPVRGVQRGLDGASGVPTLKQKPARFSNLAGFVVQSRQFVAADAGKSAQSSFKYIEAFALSQSKAPGRAGKREEQDTCGKSAEIV
jgi:hypothetical protein